MPLTGVLVIGPDWSTFLRNHAVTCSPTDAWVTQQIRVPLPGEEPSTSFTTVTTSAVLHTSDLTAYSDMYLVEVGDFEELPDLE